jgi:hypothetical protein
MAAFGPNPETQVEVGVQNLDPRQQFIVCMFLASPPGPVKEGEKEYEDIFTRTDPRLSELIDLHPDLYELSKRLRDENRGKKEPTDFYKFYHDDGLALLCCLSDKFEPVPKATYDGNIKTGRFFERDVLDYDHAQSWAKEVAEHRQVRLGHQVPERPHIGHYFQEPFEPSLATAVKFYKTPPSRGIARLDFSKLDLTKAVVARKEPGHY